MQCMQVSVPTKYFISAFLRSIELLPADQRVKVISCVLEAVQFPKRVLLIQEICSDFETSRELQVANNSFGQYMGNLRYAKNKYKLI